MFSVDSMSERNQGRSDHTETINLYLLYQLSEPHTYLGRSADDFLNLVSKSEHEVWLIISDLSDLLCCRTE